MCRKKWTADLFLWKLLTAASWSVSKAQFSEPGISWVGAWRDLVLQVIQKGIMYEIIKSGSRIPLATPQNDLLQMEQATHRKCYR